MRIPKTFKTGIRTFTIKLADAEKFTENERCICNFDIGAIEINKALGRQIQEMEAAIMILRFCLLQNWDREYSDDGKLLNSIGANLRQIFNSFERFAPNLPNRLPIDGLSVPIKIIPSMVGVKGLACFLVPVIKIAKGSKHDMMETLFHEAMHFCLSLHGYEELSSNEAFVQRTATMLARAYITMKGRQ